MRFLLLFYQQLFIHGRRRGQSRGFTLVELLISIVISSIILGSLLFLTVELVTVDRRETIVDQVQRDMNRAMEYITDDLQEAVYVYTDPQGIAAQLVSDPNFPGNAADREVPVLAFWRIDPLDFAIPDCSTLSGNTPDPELTKQADCQLLEVRQAYYTLVVYAQKENDGSDPTWSGQSRLIRYELSKYSDPTDLDWRGGYRDPTNPTDPAAQFDNWQRLPSTPRGSQAVLVDYVQAPSAERLDRPPLTDSTLPCQGYGLDDFGDPLYSVVPTTTRVDTNNSFFACVRSSALDNAAAVDAGGNGNQDVYLFLRGNVQGVNNSGVRSYSDYTSLPILETQVLARGVVNKGYRQ
ncbi:MAG: prepilin-type N-terminal cleavage/methylation domain-containing protein [Cyanobacteria bacterium J06627_28]